MCKFQSVSPVTTSPCTLSERTFLADLRHGRLVHGVRERSVVRPKIRKMHGMILAMDYDAH